MDCIPISGNFRPSKGVFHIQIPFWRPMNENSPTCNCLLADKWLNLIGCNLRFSPPIFLRFFLFSFWPVLSLWQPLNFHVYLDGYLPTRKPKKTGLVFPAPSQGNYNSKAAELEKVIEILISDSRYADVGLHDRPESSCHLSCNLRGPVVKLVAQRAFSRCLRWWKITPAAMAKGGQCQS